MVWVAGFGGPNPASMGGDGGFDPWCHMTRNATLHFHFAEGEDGDDHLCVGSMTSKANELASSLLSIVIGWR